MASCRGLDKVLKEYKDTLSPELMSQLKQVLHYHNPKKFIGHVAADQLIQTFSCGNNASVSKNITKAENPLMKEERNKHVVVFPFLIENIFPDLHLTPQVLISKEGKLRVVHEQVP